MPNVRPTDIKTVMRIEYSTETLMIAAAWKDGLSPIRSGRKVSIPLESLERAGPGDDADALVLHAMMSADFPTDVCSHVMSRWRTEFDWVEESTLAHPKPTYTLAHKGPGPRGHEFSTRPTLVIEEAPPEHRFPETALPALARLRAEVEMCEDPLQQSRLRAILDELEHFAPEPDDLDQEDQPVATTPEPSSGVSSGS